MSQSDSSRRTPAEPDGLPIAPTGAADVPVTQAFGPAKSSGESSSVRRRAFSPGLETQPTVITKNSSLASYPLRGLHPRDIANLLEGERLGHFELIEYVGGGGMGAVFRALDTMLNRIVAVKVLSQEQSSDEETLRRFQNEAQSAARLDHENISRVYYVGEDRTWHYIVFEFIEGANLRDVVEQQGPLPLADAVSYTVQIVEALVHASQRDVVHRDIKPSNVLITPQGRAKLVDMGLARLHQVEPAANDLTASGVTLGTFDYISPEQARDPRSADVRSDIYSLGCTLYFMLTGRPPFPDGTVLQKLLQHQGDQPPDPRTFRPELPDDLKQIMDRMLAKSPGDRFGTPEELLLELTGFAARHGLQIAVTTPLVVPSSSQTLPIFWTRHAPWVVPIVLLVLIVGILDLFWSDDSRRATPPPMRHTVELPVESEKQPDAHSTSTAPPQTVVEPQKQSPAKTESSEEATPIAPAGTNSESASPKPTADAPATESPTPR